jgi:hypothetical protein
MLAPDVPAKSDSEVYYKDDSRVEKSDTGDKMSYGDSGVSGPDLDAVLESGFPGQLVFVPAGSEVGAPTLLQQVESPLFVSVTAIQTPSTPVGSPSPTGSATSIPGPGTPTPTVASGGGTPSSGPLSSVIYLPLSERAFGNSGGSW